MYEAEARQVREQLSVYEASQAYYFIWPRWYSKYLFKNCAGALAVPLCHIFDFSFKNGVLPVCWKTAYVLPIYKKGCTSDPCNYRPISLTSTCCRVMERIINNSILNYLLDSSLITMHQRGFIRKRSICINLLESLHDWTLNLQTKRKLMLFILISKSI